jgi:hypothetical protein
MKRVSSRRRKRISEVAPFREAFKLEGPCERCGGRRHLIIHEIARGCDRSKALDKRYAILRLCDPGCHQIVGAWPRSKQLCLMYCKRPYDFDLPKYHALIARRHPDLAEVLEWVEPLMEELT